MNGPIFVGGVEILTHKDWCPLQKLAVIDCGCSQACENAASGLSCICAKCRTARAQRKANCAIVTARMDLVVDLWRLLTSPSDRGEK